MYQQKTPSRPAHKLAALTIAICAGLLVGLFVFEMTGVAGRAAPPAPDGVAYTPQGQSSLGDYIWHDTNFDGLQDPGEPGIDLVLVKLYLDDGDGTFEPNADQYWGQKYTGNNPATPALETGWYEFLIAVTPSFYWVVVDDSNFAPGGPLEGYIHTSPGTYGPSPLIVYFPAGISTFRDADFGYARGGIRVVKVAGDTPDGAIRRVPTPGGSVTYIYSVNNTGEGPLADVTVTDDKCAPVQYLSGDANANSLMEPAELWVFVCTATINTDTTNTATAAGQPTDPDGIPLPLPLVSDQDTAIVDIVTPGIQVVKSGPLTSYVGATVTFTFLVSNTGDSPLASLTVTDNVCGAATYQSGDANSDGQLDLAETWLYTCNYVIKSSDPDPLVNVGTVTGQDTFGGGQVTDVDQWQTDLVVTTIGDTVWFDTDGNGLIDAGEARIPNVEVCATPMAGGTTRCDITDANGVYLIEVLPGTYTVAPTNPPAGYAATTSVPHGPITLNAGDQYQNADFGYVRPTAVEIQQFTARSGYRKVTLAWIVLGDAADGFRLWRADNIKGAGAVLLTQTPIAVNPQGWAEFNDATVTVGLTYWYWLEYAADGERFGPISVLVRGDSGEKRVFLPLVMR